MKKMFSVLLVVLLNTGIALAGYPQWFEIGNTKFDAPLYNASKAKLEGDIFWTIEGFWPEEPDLIKSISLSNGEVQEWDLEAGYIIQKDPDEFDGVLYAVENNPTVEIWHVGKDFSRTLVKAYDIPLPYYDMGLQTIRAYMNGALYYIKALEDTGTSYTMRGELKVYVPAARDAVLCRLDADGNEYEYQLNNHVPNAFGVCQSLINGYAISTDGKVVWAETELKNSQDAPNVYVEIPGQGVKQIIGTDVCSALQCGYIQSWYLTWLNNDTLLFAVNRYLKEEYTHANALYTFHLPSGKYEPLTNSKGEQIYCWNYIVPGSNIVACREGTMLAYMGQANCQFGELGNPSMVECSVPIVIDLKTGTDYACYQNKESEDDPGSLYEVRNNAGRICFVD